ncbi:inositol monophosphatase family protein [Methylacidimicrobium tartarophylax]|uniref:Inositol-1-monophosphatase n=1 Tax=Methylacidimicrobium tartarophylax TaxID=1041768 RepID=A0A5E6MPR9_9BACT|nr:inositol monophosphatase family protein [Methylacidimicrobium tartarophylax]VVM08039.1 myo-inositol-1(or 4)-monophosphatase [Methylacidimicrobium tartarophylax]
MNPLSPELATLSARCVRTAVDAALVAGDLLRRSFGRPVIIAEETAYDIKIQTDRQCQELICRTILRDFPDHRILGEEGTDGSPTGEVEWIVDPLDGTVNFTYGIPHFCTSIAVRVEGQTLAGVIYDPIRQELFTTERDRSSRLNGSPVRASSRARLSEAVCVVGFSRSRAGIEQGLRLFQYLVPRVRKIRLTGSAALDLAYVASGRIDAYLEQEIHLWDIAAGVLLLQQAGGRIHQFPNAGTNTLRVTATNGLLDLSGLPVAESGDPGQVPWPS